MAKKQKSESNNAENLKQVSKGSKKIVKKDVKAEPTKKQNKKPDAATKAGKKAKPEKKDNLEKKADKKKNLEKKAEKKTIENLSEEIAAKIAKKKAKKAAQKLKKMQMKKTLKPDVGKQQQGKTKPKKLEKAVPEASSTKKEPKPTKEKVPRVPDPEDEFATVFVGNLPVNTKTPQLIRIFQDYGPVKSVRFRSASGKLLFKHKMRKEAGGLIAYVVLKDAETAEKALALNNTEFKGNHLRVTKATDKGPTDPKCTVLVGNLKYSANEEKLREIFSSCGEIEYIRCLQATPQDIASKTQRPLKAGCKGVAYVCFKSPEAVGLALELKDTLLDERPINVERYSVKKQGAQQARKEAEELAQSATNGKKKGKKAKQGKAKTEQEDTEAKKKPVFHGVKIDNIKKKNKNKSDKKLKALAKKIAPKTLLQK